ncbi:hypothetical protein, partial [Halorussus sp. GCM10023401]
MTLRSRLGVLQLPVAGVGVALLGSAVVRYATLPPSPPGSDGFVEGLALLFLYVVALVGLTTTALGLAIPPGDNVGVRFSRRQRGLFVASAAAAVGSVLAPLFALPVLAAPGVSPDASVSAVVWLWLGLLAAAVLALAAGLGWRALEA